MSTTLGSPVVRWGTVREWLFSLPLIAGRQAQIIILEILQCMDACPAVFKRGGYNFRLPPLKARDLRLDLGKNISFSDSLPGETNPFMIEHPGTN